MGGPGKAEPVGSFVTRGGFAFRLAVTQATPYTGWPPAHRWTQGLRQATLALEVGLSGDAMELPPSHRLRQPALKLTVAAASTACFVRLLRERS
jgi:hypothetical protein